MRQKFKSSGKRATIPLKQCQGMKKWAVLTTVQSPTEAVRRFIYKEHWCLIVVGDWEKPKSYKLGNYS